MKRRRLVAPAVRRAAAGSALPLTWDTTGARSAFDPADWRRYSAAVGKPAPALPALAVLTVLPQLFAAATPRGELGAAGHPWGTVTRAGCEIAVVLTPKGSSAAGVLEEMLDLGARAVVFAGGAGALRDDLPPGALVASTQALRDEGISPHYLPPGRWAAPAAALARCAAAAVDRAGPTWTTHAHFRQTLPRLTAFRAAGCVAVEAEAASIFAVGAYRGRAVAALFGIGDTIAAGRFSAPVSPPADPGPELLEAAGAALVASAAADGKIGYRSA